MMAVAKKKKEEEEEEEKEERRKKERKNWYAPDLTAVRHGRRTTTCHGALRGVLLWTNTDV